MKNELIETVLLGVALVLATAIAFTALIAELTSGGVVNEVPTFITEQVSYYGVFAIVIGVLVAAFAFNLLKQKNSQMSRLFLMIAGVLGVLLAGSQLVIAHGDFAQIGIAAVFGFVYYKMFMKGFKR